MRPRERRESGEQDLFRARLDQIIDTKHALVRLARTIDSYSLRKRRRVLGVWKVDRADLNQRGAPSGLRRGSSSRRPQIGLARLASHRRETSSSQAAWRIRPSN
jgi:hypothetical protein